MSFFGKKENKIKAKDKVFINQHAKIKALTETLSKEINAIVICWFEESLEKAEEMIAAHHLQAEAYLARQAPSVHLQDRHVFFMEHHPSAKKEQELFEKLQLKEAVFYTSLDEPLFKLFGGEKIIELMKRLGAKEDEAIEHSMISASIKNAQEKIDKKINFEVSARSQATWLEKNLG